MLRVKIRVLSVFRFIEEHMSNVLSCYLKIKIKAFKNEKVFSFIKKLDISGPEITTRYAKKK